MDEHAENAEQKDKQYTEGSDEPITMEKSITELQDKTHPDIVWGGAGVAPEIIEVTYNGRPLQVYCMKPDAAQLAKHDELCMIVKKGKKKMRLRRVDANLAIAPQCIVGVQENALGYCDENGVKFVIGQEMDGGVERMRDCLVKGHPTLVNTIANQLFLTGAYIEDADEDPLDDIDD